MSEEKFDSVRESAARYESGRGPARDPKTGRFVPSQSRKKLSVNESLADSKTRYSKTLKKLAQ